MLEVSESPASLSPVSCQGKADPSETHRAVSHSSLPGDTAKDTSTSYKAGIGNCRLVPYKVYVAPRDFPEPKVGFKAGCSCCQWNEQW